jgi:uncharacterized protein YbgA (DUF1722 family)/uncharacterized protein YbbK (DUF523 family)
LVLSKCIELCPCRYDGVVVKSPVVRRLGEFVDFVPVCPEVGIGLGIPRKPVRIVRKDGADHLVQPATGRDVTGEMTAFCAGFLGDLGEVDGFILKNKSPSSGLYDVKVYPSPDSRVPIAKGAGFFGRAVLGRFPLLPAEDDGRLREPRILEHFLTRVFTLADWRKVRSRPSAGRLIRFHTENKLLLMAHNQEATRGMGRVVARDPGRDINAAVARYEGLLLRALSRVPRVPSNANVFQHAFGHVSGGLSAAEKQYFLSLLDQYREGRIPAVYLKNILKAWIIRFGTATLADQTFFAPFPDRLAEPDTPETDQEERIWG